MEYQGRTRVHTSTKGTSLIFDDVVPESITIRKTSPKPYVYTHDTPFQEVDIVPYIETPGAWMKLLEMDVHERPLEAIFEAVVASIEERWVPDRLHIIGASSGYDSRVIAKAIQVLRKKNGEEWFGDTLFVENGGEQEGFMAIMTELGFKGNAMSWNPDYTVEYFNKIHEKYNGICSYPVNQWYDYYVMAGFKPEETQYITGYGNNEVTEAVRLKSKYVKGINKKLPPQERLRQYFKWHYYHQLATFKEFTETIHPFWNFKFIEAMAGNDNLPTRLSEILAKKFVSECNHVRKLITKDVRMAGHRTVDKNVVEQLYKNYRKTRFGERYDVVPSQDIDYNEWWQHLCIASYIEDHNIEII